MSNDEEKRKEIKKIVKWVNSSEISSIKQTVTQIINTINNPDSSANDLKNIIEIDPPLTSKLIKLANSAFYGYPKRISEIQEAIVCIGFEAVKELALGQKVCELFNQDSDINGYSRIALWKHSISVALYSKLIYRREFRKKGENMYVAGLLHDIGIIVIDQFLHSKLRRILKKVNNEKNNLIKIENNDLGFNHTDICMALAKDWGFPDEIAFAMGNHHEPDKVDDDYVRIAGTIFIADYVTQTKNIGYCDAPYPNKTLFQKYLAKLNIKEKSIYYISKEVEKKNNLMEEAGWFKNGKK